MKIRCPYCGTRIQKEAVYCRYCKHTLESQTSISEKSTAVIEPALEHYQRLEKKWMYVFLGLIGAYLITCVVITVLFNNIPGNPLAMESIKKINDFPGYIAYASSGDIYVMESSSSDVTQLTFRQEGDGYYSQPVLSPDGRYIAFLLSESDHNELVLAEIASKHVEQITSFESSIKYLDWSADSSQLLFVVQFSENNGEAVYYFNVITKELVELLNEDIFAQFDDTVWEPTNPQWSPDGTKILLTVNWGRQLAMYSLSDDHFTEFAADLVDVRDAVWSPDGSRIAFSGCISYGVDSDIFIANTDGTNIIQLTDNMTDDRHPLWSPDGTMLVFSAERNRGYNTLSVIGTQPEIQTETVIPGYPNEEYEFESPTWSPDGNSILFECRPNLANYTQIRILDLETMEISQLCDRCYDPDWK